MLMMGIFMLLAFLVGVKTAQKVQNNEIVEIPSPIKVVEEIKEHREQKEREKSFDVMLENIDNYDGTDIGQKDIPN
jgi:hypothetical protein